MHRNEKLFIAYNYIIKSFFQEWNDKDLAWRPEDYGGINDLSIPLHDVWVPSLTIYNRWVFDNRRVLYSASVFYH